MKGGLAAIMAAGAAAKKRGLRGDVIVTAVADEEYASIGTSSIVKKWHADAAIVTEPTELHICTAHKGFVWLDVETEGVAAHGSRPDLGVDAIVKMGKVLLGLEELDRSLRTAPSHRLLGSGSVHASLIQGGQELSSYPRHCSLGVERRTVPGETLRKSNLKFPAIANRMPQPDQTSKQPFRPARERIHFEYRLMEP